jgi:O-acetyl-ADP-ribose deacetylase (regulator of RNase III)
MLRVVVKAGDILDERVDVLISSANPDLNMSGGVNGAILLRGGQTVQDELKAYLREHDARWVEPGDVVKTGPGPLAVRAILHAVAIDRAYRSDTALVQRTIQTALQRAAELDAETVALPALATG